MEMKICLSGREPKPRIINVKQYSTGADKIIFDLSGCDVNTEEASCFVVGDKYRQQLILNGNNAVWDINGSFTERNGTFYIQLEITKNTVVWKSDVMLLIVSQSTSGEKPQQSSGGYGVAGDTTTLADGIVDEGEIGYVKPEISPSTYTAYRNSQVQFSTQDYTRVTWSVTGNISSDTIITDSGLLTVAINESSQNLIITATTLDGVCSSNINVTVDLSKVRLNMPSMTANTTIVDNRTYIASASSVIDSTRIAYMAFNLNSNMREYGCWHSVNSVPQWLQLQLPQSTYIKGFTMYNRITNIEAPKNFKLQGSNNGTDWTDLGEYTFTEIAQKGLSKSFDVDYEYTNGFIFYRWYFTSAISSNYIVVARITLNAFIKEVD